MPTTAPRHPAEPDGSGGSESAWPLWACSLFSLKVKREIWCG